ncbi:MAG: hypothetical protein H7A23_16325 [Leptospiraceae bacterium]|nr:hypothetical protein [Leptospiraceae bacterium]MCP5496114.1 hypothetical protein [Leptospiraceae bacterium]
MKISKQYLLAWLSLFGLLPLFSFDMENPKEPTLPQLPKAETTTKNKTPEDTKSIPILVKLCNHRVIHGNTFYKKEEFNFQHTIEGIEYKKKLHISEIKQIIIQSWKFKKDKKIKTGTKYIMLPKKVEVISNKDQSFIIDGLENTEFLSLEISNSNGKAKLFSYWIDLYKNNHTWFSKLPVVHKSYREECFPDVIKMIQLNFTKDQIL